MAFVMKRLFQRHSNAWNHGSRFDGWAHSSPVNSQASAGARFAIELDEVALNKPTQPHPARPPLVVQPSAIIRNNRNHVHYCEIQHRILDELRLRAPANGNHFWAKTTAELGRDYGVHASTICRWRKQWVKDGIVITQKFGRVVCMKEARNVIPL